MNVVNCPIWDLPVPKEKISSTTNGTNVDSARAGGLYFVHHDVFDAVKILDVPQKVMLTSWLVEMRQIGISRPKITTATLKNLNKKPAQGPYSRAIDLLEYLVARTDSLGMVIEFHAIDDATAPETTYEFLAFTSSRHSLEVIWLAECCHLKGWITHCHRNSVHQMKVMLEGYECL